MEKLFFRILSFIKYIFKAKSRHSVHSPFIFKLINEAIKSNNDTNDYHEIEQCLKSIATNNRIIETTDFGKTSTKSNYDLRFESIAHIYSNCSASSKNGRFLFRLVKLLKPVTILELGTCVGASTAYIAKASPNSLVHTFEGCSVKSQVAESLFDKLHISNAKQHIGRFSDTLPHVVSSLEKIDFAFIDGNHHYKPTLEYFNILLNKSEQNTCMVFHDIHWSRGMEKAWHEISNHSAVQVSIDLYHFGIIFFNKELSKQNFVIRYL